MAIISIMIIDVCCLCFVIYSLKTICDASRPKVQNGPPYSERPQILGAGDNVCQGQGRHGHCVLARLVQADVEGHGSPHTVQGEQSTASSGDPIPV